MTFSLIICTYLRPKALGGLLDSVNEQSLYPDEILIIDGSTTDETGKAIEQRADKNLSYYLVPNEQRGLTRQRNYGIERVNITTEVVCFLDDDTILEPDYFKELISSYTLFPDALGVGGYITNEVVWKKLQPNQAPSLNEFAYDGWVRKEGSRFVLRKKLGLDSNLPPAYFPEFGHGRSVSFLPPSGRTYPTQQLMGGVSSFKREVFGKLKFSTYFEGYGLYEDADFTLRVSKTGKLYVNTAARLGHFHEESGRPDTYRYGKMVGRNGWYVWRVAYPNPSLKAKLKWHSISFLLTLIRFGNALSGPKRKAAFMEAMGRVVGWWSLWYNKPKRQ